MIPLGTDRITRKTPVTVAIVVTNVLIFLVVSLGLNSKSALASTLMETGTFYPGARTVLLHPWTLVTYAFLHDPSGLSHVAFNMLFLWIFGRAVEDRIGSVWFLAFYLAGAVAAALGQWLVDPAPMIGASGAVAAATGAFAALCPRSRVRVLFFLSIIEVPGIVLVLIFVALDLFGQFGKSISGAGGVAYSAHLFGYAFGAATMIALLASGVLRRTEFDLFFLMKQWRRRRIMRAATAHSASPWHRDAARVSSDVAATAAGEPARKSVPNRSLSDAEAKRELTDASARWVRGEFSAAASAWERFAQRCPSHPDADGAILLAAMASVRKLGDPARGLALAQRVLDRVPAATEQTIAQARALIAEAKGAAPS